MLIQALPFCFPFVLLVPCPFVTNLSFVLIEELYNFIASWCGFASGFFGVYISLVYRNSPSSDLLTFIFW